MHPYILLHFEEMIFPLVKPNHECRSAVTQFLCLYTFELCGPNNENYRPAAAQSREIRDSSCESEWKRIKDLLALAGLPPLPDCSTLNDEGVECDYGRPS